MKQKQIKVGGWMTDDGKYEFYSLDEILSGRLYQYCWRIVNQYYYVSESNDTLWDFKEHPTHLSELLWLFMFGSKKDIREYNDHITGLDDMDFNVVDTTAIEFAEQLRRNKK